LYRGVYGGDHQPWRAGRSVRKARQGIDAPGRDLAIGRYPIIGQAVPGWDGDNVETRCEELDQLGQLSHARVVARDVQDTFCERALSQDEGIHTLRRAGDGEPPGGANFCSYVVHAGSDRSM
jgi:hypothetical protein